MASKDEIDAYIDAHLDPEDYQSAYEDVYQSNERWNQIQTSEGQLMSG